MFTEPTIHSPADPNTRSYVSIYIEGERYRFYNGRVIEINCNPNRAKSLQERNRALSYLAYQLRKKLEQGWRPWHEKAKSDTKNRVTALTAFNTLKEHIKNESISELYLRDLLAVIFQFVGFLEQEQLNELLLPEIKANHVDRFLSGYKSSATNYMNRRRTLSALFARLISLKMLSANPVQETAKQKQVSLLNVPYKEEQLKVVLNNIRQRHDHLYLCCLLMYGCLLRPHQEIRLLKKSSFDDCFTKISLSGNQNKSRRIRTVHIPLYVKSELLRQGIDLLEAHQNIFSHSPLPFNISYFNTAWSRIKAELIKDTLITQKHTLYSFRHTAAVNMYLKTKDPFKIQQVFGHSSLQVTLIYLRNLGLLVNASLNDLPDSPISYL